MAAFARALAAWSREADFTLTLTFFERMLSHPQVNQLVGDFTSILLFEVHVGAAELFEALAKRMATRLWSDSSTAPIAGCSCCRKWQSRVPGQPCRSYSPVPSA